VKPGAMLIPTLLLAVMALALLIVGYDRGGGEHIVGLKTAATLTWRIAPLLICAFVVAGMLPVLLPKEQIANWVGAESGFRGILDSVVVVVGCQAADGGGHSGLAAHTRSASEYVCVPAARWIDRPHVFRQALIPPAAGR